MERRLRHAVSVTCANRRSFAADQIESQMARLLTARFRLPQDWQRKYLLALAADAETGPTAGKPDRQRLERARENLRSLFVWGELAEADYRCQREEIDRQILAIATVAAPVAVTSIRRAAELPQDRGRCGCIPESIQNGERNSPTKSSRRSSLTRRESARCAQVMSIGRFLQ